MDTFNNKTYFVLPIDMLQAIDINSIEEQSYELVRKSVDQTMCIVEYRGSIEAFGGTFLTHAQALSLMSTPEWIIDDPLTQAPPIQ